ncbi:MAG TPA: hypothetical protein VEI47_05275, partial [Gemmatimonadales bacterium]|nr:hypothetical protein [Gemmatimonadales bacterium]
TNPAPGPGGRLAWVEAHSPVGSLSPLHRTIRTGSLAVTDSGQVAITLPYVASSGQLHGTAIDLAWIGSDTLVYVGAEALIGSVCNGCKKDTLVTGRDIVLLDLKDPTHTPNVVPGTTSASSVWPSADGTAIYYTLGGDTKVYRRSLALGAVSVVADLDTLGITRDVSVQDSVLLAVAGGLVSYNVNPVFDRLQGDSGGVLIRLDLRAGGPVALGDTFHYYRRPRLSPDRRFVVTEGTDRKTGLQIATLWLITLP